MRKSLMWIWKALRGAMLSERGAALRTAALALLLAGSLPVQAAEVFCSEFPLSADGRYYVIDGSNTADSRLWPTQPSSISIDQQPGSPSCYIKNFMAPWWPEGLTGQINYANGSSGLVIFENSIINKMTCGGSARDVLIWLANGATANLSADCQKLLIPIEKIDKQAPGVNATVGVPFNYTLKVPVMYNPATGTTVLGPSVNTLANVTIYDDLTTVGASLSLASPTSVCLWNGATCTPLNLDAYQATKDQLGIPASDTTKHIVISSDKNPVLTNIPAGTQLEIRMTVVLDDVPTNVAGTPFTNTAKWWFGRVIDGVAYTPLPGESGVSPPMTIVEPRLTMEKSGTPSLNVGGTGSFQLNLQNAGAGDAWNIVVTDRLPVGMQAFDPTTSNFTAAIYDATGSALVSSLTKGTHYTTSYSGGQITVTLADSVKLAKNQRLIIDYQANLDATLDPVTTQGQKFINVAGATEWYNAPAGTVGRRGYTRGLTDGTPTVTDHEDAFAVTAAYQGYYFLKSVGNVTQGVAAPATIAMPGDKLRYTLQIQNFTLPSLDNISIVDDFGKLNAAAFVPGSLQLVSSSCLPAPSCTPAVVSVNASGGTGGAGQITINGLSLKDKEQYTVVVDITLASGLTAGTIVRNQGTMAGTGPTTATDPTLKTWNGVSDNPFVNGAALLEGTSPPPESTDITILTVGPLAKVNPAKTTATIGETFSYQVKVPANPVPVPLYDVRIHDTLPANLRYVGASVAPGGSWTLINTGIGSNVVIEDVATGGIDIPANGQAVINVTVAVQNTAANQAGVTFTNTAWYTFNKSNGDDTSQGTTSAITTDPAMTVVEPLLGIAKTVSYAQPSGKLATAPADVGDVLQYTVTITNSGASNVSTAYDASVQDYLPTNLALVAGSVTAKIDGVLVSGFVAQPTTLPSGAFVWGAQNGDNLLDIPKGGTLELTYRATVVSVNGSDIANSAWVDWTSLDDGVIGERTGAGCPSMTAPDVYCRGPATRTVTALDPTALTKTVASDSWSTAPSSASDATLRVGDTVIYTLTATLREDMTQNVVITDTLPAGMAFDGVVSINGDTASPYTSAVPFSFSSFTAPVVSGNTITWSLGHITNATDNIAANNGFVIQYRARVVNTLAQLPTTQQLSNSATLNYAIAGVDAAPKSASVPITVRQPNLSVVKNAAPAGGGTVIAASEWVNYTVNITNTGDAPAYNTVVQDTLPQGMRSTTPVVVSISLVNVGTVLPSLAPTYDSTTGLTTWNFDTAVANEYAIPAGETLRIVYRAQADAGLSAGMTLTNLALVQHYYSLDKTDPNTTRRKDYGATTPSSVTLTTAAAAALSKQALVSSAAIGQSFTYRITVPATPQATALHDVRVTDDISLATRGVSLSYMSASARLASNAKTWATLTNSGTATGLVLEDATAGGGLDIPAGDQLVVDVVVVLTNDVTNNTPGKQFTNTANYSYNSVNNDNATLVNGVSGSSGFVTIAEPSLSVSKSAAAAGGDTVIAADEVVIYTVDIRNASMTAPAYDTMVQDTLPLGMRNTVPVTVSMSLVTAGTTLTPLAPTYNSTTGVTSWSLNGSGYAIPANETLRIEYRTQADASLSAGMTLTNRAVVPRYYSQISTNPNARVYGPTGTASVTLTTAAANALAKQALVSSVAIGQPFTYRITVPATPQATALHDVRVTDDISLGTTGVSLSYVSASARLASNAKTWATLNNSGTATSLTLQDSTTGGLDIPAGDQLMVDVVVVLTNDITNNTPGKQFTNTANYSFNSVNNDATTQTPGAPGASGPVTITAPSLTVLKTAAPAGGDTVIGSNELVIYTVDVRNTSGTAPAYNTVVQDTLPFGMRTTTPVVVSISLVNAGTALAPLAPSYNSATGVVTWNFDTAVANQYAIPAGDTLRIVYRAQADVGLSAGMTLTNSALVQHYYSLDKTDPNAGSRKDYGATPSSSVTLTTAAAAVLSKQALVSTAAIGQSFTYRITVPATPQATALHDVRVTDDISLATTGVSLSYMSASARLASNAKSWATLTNSGTATGLVLQDATAGGGLDIPAGDQLVVDVVVVLTNDVTNNTPGKQFTNTANYSYNSVNNDNSRQASGASGASAPVTIAAPKLVMVKSGPATIRAGTPAVFTLDLKNDGNPTDTATAWNVVLSDLLPNVTTAPAGGMCGSAPTIVSARVYQADGTTAVSAPLVSGTDFTTSFAAAPSCTMTVRLLTAAAAIAPTQRLIVRYSAALDTGSANGLTLTNIAGATQWLSANPAVAGMSGFIQTTTKQLTNGTPGLADFEDAYAITTEVPVLEFRKTVVNLTTGQNPGTNARPGDTLRYTIRIRNVSAMPLSNVTLTDELDRLNASAMFAPGSLRLVSAPSGAITSGTNASGGAKGTGLLDVRGLNIAPTGTAGDTLQVEFEARLAPVITHGTVVLNQAQLPSVVLAPLNSDDPNVNGADSTAVIGDEDPTRTVISSSPLLRVQKTSQDLTGDPAVLVAGDRLRYTITVKNVGGESAVNVVLRDLLPANTSYVAGTTRLNGAVLADVAGASPLQTGLLISAPDNTTAGTMRADATTTPSNVATITFDVQLNAGVVGGTVISNQGFVNGSGVGSGVFPETPSDDPRTALVNDPTRNVVGTFPLLVAQKTVALTVDSNGTGVLDPLDVVRYTITISNLSSRASTSAVLTDLVPANTSYVADSVRLNGAPVAQPDGGVSPLIAGVPVNSPGSASGTIGANGSAVLSFDVRVNAAVAAGTVISNQGSVASTELPAQLTDADGNSDNGLQPTTIVVGSAQQVSVTKAVTVVGGGAALPGAQLEYLVTVTNTGATAATQVVLTDDLAPLATQVSYVAGSATLNGSTTGVSLMGAVLRADYAATYGLLAPGATAQLRFRVQVVAGLAEGTVVTNSGQVVWNNPALTASASASVTVGSVPNAASLSGRIWHDASLNQLFDTGEVPLAGWTVDVLRNSVQLGSVTTDANGQYRITGLVPSTGAADQFVLRFNAPGAGASTAKLGRAISPFVNGLQSISGIVAPSGSNLQNLNLPVQPNGVTYDSVVRTPVAGATLTLLRAGSTLALPSSCFDDPAQQGQVTPAAGYYKFDLNFSDPSCPSGGDYLIQVTVPSAYTAGPSKVIPPLSDASTTAFSVPNCPASASDAVPATTSHCEAQPSEFAPAVSVAAATVGTNHFLRVVLNNSAMPGTSQIYNNHLAIDPRLNNAVTITKVAALQSVTRGQLVPYTITVSNTMPVALTAVSVVDTFPAGFKYVAGSSRMDGETVEPVLNGNQLTWANLQLATNTKRVIQLMLVVGSGVGEGKYVNRAQVVNFIGAVSPEATAAVRVVPDPTLDCSDIIGKVFDDANLNGQQDEGEKGLPGVRAVTARGLIVTSDSFGRFHLTCAVVPDPDRGSNFIVKVDDRSLPSGYRITTENPLVQRVTRGKMVKFNFGAAIHRVVKLDLADGVFEPGTTEIRVQWRQRMALLLGELKKAASVLRLSYLAETEQAGLVNERLMAVKREIETAWKQQPSAYDLAVETEVFWRTGASR